jgi:glycosyltransferase involved in cell wall biosynthesis
VRLAVTTNATILGGAERLMAAVLAELRPDIEVTLIGVDRATSHAIAAGRPGTRIALVPPIRHKADVRSMLRFARVLARVRPDVLHINLPTPWQCRHETALGVLAPGVRTLRVYHLPVEPDREWDRWVARALARAVDANIAVGVRAAREVERQVGLAPGTIRTIESAVPAFEVEHRRNGATLIGTTARLDRQKGLDVLLRALPSLPGVQVEIVGDGPERARLTALARQLGVSERVRFAGWSENAREWLGRWDAFVLPSRFEGLPLAILDAMLAELPVVASDVGSVGEAVSDGETGMLVQPDDPGALAAALERVLSDRELARRLGQAGRRRALERFTAEAAARRYEALYEELCA